MLASAPRLVPRLLPFVLGLSMVAVADEATACLDLGNPCEDAVGWSHVELLATADIALDGVLLFGRIQRLFTEERRTSF